MISTNKKINIAGGFCFLLLLLTLGISSCKKRAIIGEDPYAGGKEALGIRFLNESPSPEIGLQGGEATFSVKGLKAYENKFDFFVNDEKAEVLALTDSTILVKIPNNASSGGAKVVLDGQTFFGPLFTITGKLSLDASFKVINGSNGTIYDMIQLPTSNFLLGGSFTDFENKAALKPVNGIASISEQGEYQSSLMSAKGVQGALLSVNRLVNGKFIIAGSFNTYNNRKGINQITRLNPDGSLDSTVVSLINVTPEKPLNGLDTLATFNGGVDGTIRKTFIRNNQITVVGNFRSYYHYFYERSTRDNKIIDQTRMNQLVRMQEDGSIDLTYNYDVNTKKSYEGGNGPINDAYMQDDGKVVLVGNFSSFNGKLVNYICRLNVDGTLDNSFNTGTGADNSITTIVYNPTTQKIMLSGIFKTFNGVASNGLIRLNRDGSIDDSFKTGALSGGVITFASQLNNGKVIVAGSFSKYNNIVRQGFMVLNADGSLAIGYNNTGAFQGQIYKLIETRSALGNPAIIIAGSISKFDNKRVGNIVRVEIKL